MPPQPCVQCEVAISSDMLLALTGQNARKQRYRLQRTMKQGKDM
nr:MAG TPA_asm: hypothetical protein [Caudoviricetes sp.]